MCTVTEVKLRLRALTENGVSVWLDQIRRSWMESGELARMVAEESLRGVTSNPSIFEKAILGSTDYDQDLRTLARENLDSTGIYEHIGSATCSSRPTCWPTFTARRTGATGSCRWRSRRGWPTIPR